MLEDTYQTLKSFGFHPRIYRTRNKVIPARQEEIDHYFREIGFHNSTHIKRYLSLIGIQSSVAPVV